MRNSASRLEVALALIMMEIIAFVLLKTIIPNDGWYYTTCALINIVQVFYFGYSTNLLCYWLMWLSFAQGLCQLAGLVIYEYEWPVIYYDYSIRLITLFEFVYIFFIGKGGEGGTANNLSRTANCLRPYLGLEILLKKKTET